MLVELHDRIVIADFETGCDYAARNAKIHACKAPCHQNFVGYKGNLPKDHPNYLWLERGGHLVLNIVDAPIPIFRHEVFLKALDFLETEWNNDQCTLIHCNRGVSRSPVIAALFLAKRAKVIPDNWEQAHAWLIERVPDLKVGQGLATWMEQHWEDVR